MAKTQEIINQMNILKSQGLSNSQGIEALQKKGYSYTDILGAMNEMQTGGNNMMPNMPSSPAMMYRLYAARYAMGWPTASFAVRINSATNVPPATTTSNNGRVGEPA